MLFCRGRLRNVLRFIAYVQIHFTYILAHWACMYSLVTSQFVLLELPVGWNDLNCYKGMTSIEDDEECMEHFWPRLSRWFPLRTAQSQHPNVYKHYKSSINRMRIDVTRYEPRTLSLRPLKLFSQQLHCFLLLRSCLQLRIHNGGCFETLRLPHVISGEMFTFCDALHE